MAETKSMMSRRKVLGLVATGLVTTPLLLRGAPTDSQTGASLRASGRELTVTPASDPEFARQLDELFPGIKSVAEFQSIAPLALLITSQSGPGIRAYTVCWSVTTAAGTYETALFRFAPPNSKRKDGKITIASGQINLLTAGASKLITPYFALSPNTYKSGSADWQSLIQSREPANLLRSSLSASSTTRAWIDAVVYADRKVLGPDTHRLGKRLRGRRNAEHDQAHAINKLLKANKSVQEIQEALFTSGIAPRSTETGPLAWYQQARRHHAQVLLKKSNTLDRVTFTALVQRLSAQHNTVLPAITG